MSSLNDSVIVIKHFCFNCKQVIEVLTSEQRCGRCGTGFVEEISEKTDTSKESHQNTSEESKDNANESSAESECTICLESMDSTQNNLTLDCRHTFHNDCVKQWFQRKKSCPVCRTVVTPLRVGQPDSGGHLMDLGNVLSPFSRDMHNFIDQLSDGYFFDNELDEMLTELQNRARQLLDQISAQQ